LYVGPDVGCPEGRLEGHLVGCPEGCREGWRVGCPVGVPGGNDTAGLGEGLGFADTGLGLYIALISAADSALV